MACSMERATMSTPTKDAINYYCAPGSLTTWSYSVQAAWSQELTITPFNPSTGQQGTPITVKHDGNAQQGEGTPTCVKQGSFPADDSLQHNGKVAYAIQLKSLATGNDMRKVFSCSNNIQNDKLITGNLCVGGEDSTDDDFNDGFVTLSWVWDGKTPQSP